MLSYDNSVRRFFADQLFAGIISAVLAERKLVAKQETCSPPEPGVALVARTITTKHIEANTIRRKGLEEKARANLFALTICSSIVFSGLSMITNHDTTSIVRSHFVLRWLFVLPLAYFAGAAFAAVKVLQVGQVYTLSLEEECLESEEIDRRSQWYLEMNQMSTIIKANWAWVSFTCLRNAVFVLFGFAVVAGVIFSRQM
jgi:hypothetical protein